MKNFIKKLSIVSIMALGVNAQVVNLTQGWNNIGIVGDTPISSFNNNNVQIVWEYDSVNHKWLFYSPLETYMDQVRRWINDGFDYGFINTLRAGDAVWVYSSNNTTINIGAVAYTSMMGFVKDAINNIPINSFTVLVDNQEYNFNDSNGSFVIPNVTLGDHNVIIRAEGYRDYNLSADIEEPVTYNVGQISLIPQNVNANIEVRGRVLNAVNGQNIENVRMRIFEGANNTNGQPVVDTILTDGNYDVNLSAGTYTVALSAEGFYPTTYTYTFASENESITQDFSLAPEATDNNNFVMRAVLTWGETPRDLDSHFFAYNPETNETLWHVYFGKQYAYMENGQLYNTDSLPSDENITEIAELDHDDTSSYGPETVTLKDLNASLKYVYYVWNWSNEAPLKDSNAHVVVLYNGQEYQFNIPYEDGRAWKVFEIDHGVLVPCVTNCVRDINDHLDANDMLNRITKTTIDDILLREILNSNNSPKN